MDWVKTVNLAPLKYRNILMEQGGPIARLSIIQKQLTPSIVGHEALAYLVKDLKNGWNLKHRIYGNVDGAGSSEYKNQASYKSISEALERWAFYEIYNNAKVKNKYGFNIDPTTTGMARSLDC
ncbi:MAG: hypothetical protein HY072_01700 [Deltaproteobacteria bacterium]|nr:hypothetical protein [Deltaproteobacteria bacterium]